MTDRKAKQRRLNKAGFEHVSGWVRADKAPDIQREIDETKAAVEKEMEREQGN